MINLHCIIYIMSTCILYIYIYIIICMPNDYSIIYVKYNTPGPLDLLSCHVYIEYINNGL